MNIGLEDAEGGPGPRSDYCNTNSAGFWQPRTVDVTDFAQAHEGQQIVVSAVTAGDATLNTNFFLDEISLQVTTADSVTHDLTVASAGTGTGTVASSPAGLSCGETCSVAFNEGTEVVLTASPASDSTFTGWSGDCTGTGTCTISMTEARSVTAAFNLNPIRRPDGMIRRSTESSFAGNNIYNSTGSGQSKTSSGRRTTSKSFIVRIQNDGGDGKLPSQGSGQLKRLQSCLLQGNDRHYRSRGRGVFQADSLTPGATRSIKVKITATLSAAYGTTKNVAITSRSQVVTAKADTVKAAMKAVR